MSQNVNMKNKVQKTKLKKVYKTKVIAGASLSKKEKKDGLYNNCDELLSKK